MMLIFPRHGTLWIFSFIIQLVFCSALLGFTLVITSVDFLVLERSGLSYAPYLISFGCSLSFLCVLLFGY